MADKLEMMSSNIIQENIDYIALKFPNAVTEVKENGKLVKKIDFDILKQELSTELIDDKQERYQMTWPDKKKSIHLANGRVNATLRPDKRTSVNFDNTKNLYIEGDNLDVLKLIRETYLGKVKMIYIDPPYNTGNDFVYKDDFAQSTNEYTSNSGQFDKQGNRLFQNTESSGRFHTDWLNMIYPRLKSAKDLLKPEGVIFISIDDNEYANLKKITDEIFGSDNFISTIIWRRKTGSSDAKGIATITEYILVYMKNKDYVDISFNLNNESFDINRYKYKDEYENRRGMYYSDNLDRGSLGYVESLDFGIEAPDGQMAFPNGRTSKINDGWRWTWGKDKVEWGLKNGFLVFKENKDVPCGWRVYRKNYLKVNNEDVLINKGAPFKNYIGDILNTKATIDLEKMFGKKVFEYSKPVDLIKFLISLINIESYEIIVDFFSGSATTAHSVLQLNAEDGSKRKFIMIQLPETSKIDSEAYKLGFLNICEIGKERIKRAGETIKADTGIFRDNIDVGFRVLKLDSSNMKDVYYNPNVIQQVQLDNVVSNIKEDRTPLDLLFQVMLELGIELSAKIEEKEVSGKTCFVVNENDIVACFDDGINDEVVKELAKIKSIYAVFKDSAFSSDASNINCEQIFKSISPATNIKVI